MMMKQTFQEILSLAAKEAASEDAPTIPAIAKELLHYDILLAISRSALAKQVVFQGGTALRLCYGGQRYSEDLDFAVGPAGEPFMLSEVEAILKRHMMDRYGVQIRFAAPPDDRVFGGGDTVVKKWTFIIEIPGLNKTQKINIEFCNINAYDVDTLLLQPRYSFLPPQYHEIALQVETQNEIFADKVVAVANRPYLKARDIWDMKFLSQGGHTPDIDLICRKIKDYHVVDIFGKIDISLARLNSQEASEQFVKEMTRFVTPRVASAINMEKPPGKSWLKHTVKIMEGVKTSLMCRSDMIPSMEP
jgi:predicted nucleotidyltransferase component of viral defense system